ncbi:MAG: hypothetical protein ACE5E1_04730 [Phycisphaerae bacterium]
MALHRKTQRALLLWFIASIAGSALVGIYCLLIGRMGNFEARVLGTVATVTGVSLLALGASIPTVRRTWHPLGPTAIVASLLPLPLTVFLIWSNPRTLGYRMVGSVEDWTGTAWTLAVALTLIGLLSLARLKPAWNLARLATVAVILLLAGQIIWIIFGRGYLPDPWDRVMGILVILVSCGVIAVPILHRVSAIPTRTEVFTAKLSLSLTCPRCGKSQQLAIGSSSCADCGLRFRIEIEEEACRRCGYPLYKIESAVCPECGTPIRREPRPA